MRAARTVLLAIAASLALAPGADAQRRRHRHVAPMPVAMPAAGGYARDQIERCRRSDALACREAGVHLARGEGGARRDGDAAARLLERAWTIDRDEGCEWFFHLRDELPPGAVDRACAHGCSFACESRAFQRLGLDPAEGVETLERLCDRGSAHACLTLGHALLDGRLISRDRRGGIEHVGRACDLGGATACYEMAVEGWGAELQRRREEELDPARRAATAPLRAPRRARSPAPGASPPSLPTRRGPPPRTGERFDDDPPPGRSARAAAR